jgi:hypothetical protein
MISASGIADHPIYEQGKRKNQGIRDGYHHTVRTIDDIMIRSLSADSWPDGGVIRVSKGKMMVLPPAVLDSIALRRNAPETVVLRSLMQE